MSINWFELAKTICHGTEPCGTCGEDKPINDFPDCDDCIRQQDEIVPDPYGQAMDDKRDLEIERELEGK